MHNITTLMTRIAGCLCRQIHESELTEPCFCGIMPGDRVPLDYVGGCDDKDGMAWVRLTSAYPSEGTGTVSTSVRNCGAALSIDLELGIIRTAPSMTEEGEPPDEGAQLKAADQQISDMMAMFKAVSCCEALFDLDYILGQYKPMGPQGYALGGTVPLIIGIGTGQ